MMRIWRNARKVERVLGIPNTTVSRWWRRWNSGERVEGQRSGSGRPRLTTQATDRKLVVACKRNRFQSVPKLVVAWKSAAVLQCSIRTAYRRLAEAGIRSYRPAIRIPLSVDHKKRRKQWCQEHSTWSQEQWRAVMWSDESRFTLDFHDGRIHVHRLPGHRFAPCCLREHDRYGGGSVMVWAAIWYGGRSELCIVDGTMTGRKYRDEIIVPNVIPTVHQHELVFQHDNATPHRAIIVQQCLNQCGIQPMDWPARSPDLSPIEHAWDVLGRRLRDSYSQPPATLAVLKDRLQTQWQLIDQCLLNSLCESMPQRLRECLTSNGGHTRY